MLVKPALLALQAKPVNPAKMALQVVLALPVMVVLQAVLVNKAVQAVQESQAKMVPQAAANTAHRLVWLQVIKRRRSTSRAMSQIGHQLGRLFINDQYHRFVQNFGLFNTAFLTFIFNLPFLLCFLFILIFSWLRRCSASAFC